MKDALRLSNLLALNFRGGHGPAPQEVIERALNWYDSQIHPKR